MHSSHSPSRPGLPAQIGELVLCIAAAVAIVAVTDRRAGEAEAHGPAPCVGCVAGPGTPSR